MHAGPAAGGLSLRFVVTVAFDGGDPIFLISGLAEHTKNLERDPRASLLVAESGSAIRSPTAASPCSDRAAASRRCRPRAAATSPLTRARATTRTSATSPSEAAGGPGPLHRRLWPDVVGQQDRLAGRRARSARSVGRRHHGSYERRPRRRHGAVLQGIFKSHRDHRRQHDRSRQVRLRDVGDDPAWDHDPSVWRSARRSARRRKCAPLWSRW